MKASLLILPLVLAGCGEIGMDRQAKVLPQSGVGLVAGEPVAAEAPAGTVALGSPAREVAALTPPPVSLTLVERGRERHAIACAPCHGATGAGDGSAVQRGYPRPAPYDDARQRGLSSQALYHVITDGYGIMLPQAERLAPRDRWAVIAYVRALQARPQPAAAPS